MLFLSLWTVKERLVNHFPLVNTSSKKMSREKRKDSKKGNGGGFLSPFLGVACAAVATTAVIIGCIYTASSKMHPPEAVWTKPIMGWMSFAQIQSAWRGQVQKLKPNLEADDIYKEAILKGLDLAMGKGLTKLILEGIVNFVNNGQKGKSSDPLISGIRELLNNPPWQNKLTWIRRKANKVVDKLPKMV